MERRLPEEVPADPPPDAELARRILLAPGGGARDAEAQLCARLRPRLRLYGLRHLRDASAAEDLAQRVLVVTLEKLRAGAVREPERIASFVLGVARAAVLEAARGARRDGAAGAPSPGAAEPTAEGAEPEPLARERLARCLERLSERERTVVLLAFYEERSAREIGEAIAATEGNVRVIRHRAVARLRGCVEGEAA